MTHVPQIDLHHRAAAGSRSLKTGFPSVDCLIFLARSGTTEQGVEALANVGWNVGWEKMARGIHRLTALQVAKAARKGLTVADGGGLILQRGSSWIFRYCRRGKEHWLGLGPLELLDLSSARDAALAARKQLHTGTDPLAARRLQQAADATSMTFDEASAAYIEAHREGWKNPRHREQWASSLKADVSPVIGKLPVQAIDTAQVLRVLEPIWKAKAETASRLRGRIESILGWATARGHRSGENPARWKGHLDQLLVARDKVRGVQHHSALPYAALPAFMARLRQQNGTAARALEFVILTATRTGDITGQAGRDDAPPMLWEHVDVAAQLWTVPKTKNGAEHRVPLSDAACALLGRMHGTSGIVFPGRKSGTPLDATAMLIMLKRMGVDATVHGFRATFKTWASEHTNYPHEIVEAALTHTISDALERAYRRSDFLEKRARLMRAWGDFCAGKTGSAAVVPLRA
jgi:integrase